ncbi:MULTISPECIES: GNAT family N-acetyltransferase [unclassified Pseudomonas]|uniref:GNAT family N-acetyltransferase n=1 Tax=unclassified Pseudomonas TaxID=196821 RepID=UPI0020977EE8|nr:MULTISPECIES: GNAT family N-acetyltransferase [unclassified Pseudomonas]MCO7520630.1 GNAT family N-acetyltransferase [Pseudomonas sp. 1]MCO7538695.1 GNAT family N-acetyltransferase [Pseudomonas sp. VA159-2]
MIVVRGFEAQDAEPISELFTRVYGERYFYPQIYLPSVIRHHNRSQHWQSVVALRGERIVGHALLWRSSEDASCAELAMIVVDPQLRGRGIAGRMSRYLCDHARRQGMSLLTIKMVASHLWSQRLGMSLGFQATGLLLDYVESGLSAHSRESAILGVLALQAQPIPMPGLQGGRPQWLAHLLERFGRVPAGICQHRIEPTRIALEENRLDLTLEHPCEADVLEVMRLSTRRLIHLRVRLDASLPCVLPGLHRAGFADTGLALGAGRQWYWLLQRGFADSPLQLHCPMARAIHAQARQCMVLARSG